MNLNQRVEKLESEIPATTGYTREAVEKSRACVKKMLDEPVPERTPEEDLAASEEYLARFKQSLRTPAPGPGLILLHDILIKPLVRDLENELDIPEDERFSTNRV